MYFKKETINLKNENIEHIQNLLLISLLIDSRDIVISASLTKTILSNLNSSKKKALKFVYETDIYFLSSKLRQEVEFEKNNPNHYVKEKSPTQITTNHIIEYLAKLSNIEIGALILPLPKSSGYSVLSNHVSYEDFVSRQVLDLYLKLYSNPIVRIFKK